MRVRIEFEVELHLDGDKVTSCVRTQATTRGVRNDKPLSAGLLHELKPQLEAMRDAVHDAVIRRVASGVYSRRVEIRGFSAWRPTPPTADDVRECPWWWHRSPDGTHRVIHLETRIGSDIIIDVEEWATNDCGVRFDPAEWPGEWARCDPPSHPSHPHLADAHSTSDVEPAP